MRSEVSMESSKAQEHVWTQVRLVLMISFEPTKGSSACATQDC